MKFSSALLSESVDQFAKLPGIGKKTALRTILYLLQKNPQLAKDLSAILVKAVEEINECQKCHNLSDHQICGICTDKGRDQSVLCLVENIRDVMAIEDTGQFRGVYHILGGVISPIDGIGPDKLNIESLLQRVETEEIREIIMAVSPTIEGETTMYFITQQLRNKNVKVSIIARGVSFGGELEYADELTLGRSISGRQPYLLAETV